MSYFDDLDELLGNAVGGAASSLGNAATAASDISKKKKSGVNLEALNEMRAKNDEFERKQNEAGRESKLSALDASGYAIENNTSPNAEAEKLKASNGEITPGPEQRNAETLKAIDAQPMLPRSMVKTENDEFTPALKERFGGGVADFLTTLGLSESSAEEIKRLSKTGASPSSPAQGQTTAQPAQPGTSGYGLDNVDVNALDREREKNADFLQRQALDREREKNADFLQRQNPDQPSHTSPSGDHTLKGLWESHGVDYNDFIDKFAKGMSAVESVIPGINWRQPIGNSAVGLVALTKAVDQASGGKAGAVQTVLAPTVQSWQDVTQPFDSAETKNAADIQQNESNQKAAQEAVAKSMQAHLQAAGLNSFGSILAYVMTSMIIGPKLALLFFQDREKMGQSQEEMNFLLNHGNELKHEHQVLTQAQQHLRASAAAATAGQTARLSEGAQAQAEMWRREQSKLQFLYTKFAGDKEMQGNIQTVNKTLRLMQQAQVGADKDDMQAKDLIDQAQKASSAIPPRKNEAKALMSQAEEYRKSSASKKQKHIELEKEYQLQNVRLGIPSGEQLGAPGQIDYQQQR